MIAVLTVTSGLDPFLLEDGVVYLLLILALFNVGYNWEPLHFIVIRLVIK